MAQKSPRAFFQENCFAIASCKKAKQFNEQFSKQMRYKAKNWSKMAKNKQKMAKNRPRHFF